MKNNERSLNDEQKLVSQEIISSSDTNEGGIFFLDAPGGTGKTFLINLLLAKVRFTHGHYLGCAGLAPPVIAATLPEEGQFVINISKQSNFAEELKCQ